MGDGLKRAAAAADETKPRAAGKFGKQETRHDPRTLRLSALLAPDLPPPPDIFSALPRVEQATKVADPRRLFPMDGNDVHGCCVIAAAAHAETLWEAFAGKKRVPTKSVVLRDYFHLTGGEDSGLVEIDTLNYWRQTGITGERILAYAAVDWKDRTRLRQAISIFGSVFIGFQVQRFCVDDFNHHRMWKPESLTNEGHAVLIVGYTPDYVVCLTWGGVQRGTNEWLEECCDECYAIIPGEATLKGFAPGLDYAALQSALQAVTA